MRDEVRLLIEKMVKGIDTAGTDLSVKILYRRMLADLFKTKKMQSLAECVRERVSVEDNRAHEGGIRMKFLKSEPVSGEFDLL